MIPYTAAALLAPVGMYFMMLLHCCCAALTASGYWSSCLVCFAYILDSLFFPLSLCLCGLLVLLPRLENKKSRKYTSYIPANGTYIRIYVLRSQSAHRKYSSSPVCKCVPVVPSPGRCIQENRDMRTQPTNQRHAEFFLNEKMKKISSNKHRTENNSNNESNNPPLLFSSCSCPLHRSL